MSDGLKEIAAALALLLTERKLTDTPEWRDLMRFLHPGMNPEMLESEQRHQSRRKL